MLDPTDTIAAVASPPGGGMLGLVRVTGPAAVAVVLAGFEADDPTNADPAPRASRRVGWLRVDALRRPLAVAVTVWPGPRTYTGQPLVEVQTPGAAPILAAVLASFLGRGARLAEPGEFTLRAFLAGRIDLTQAEAVLGVIDAGSPAQLDAALRQLAGGLAGPLTQLRDDLADTLAHLEANLDFADEADVDPLGRPHLAARLRAHGAEVARLADQLSKRGGASGRPRVVLVGPPNAGKSRLFNALIRRDAALVAPIPGTTRDYLEAACDCDGLLVDLVDTAGTETTSEAIGNQAQTNQAAQTATADLVLLCRPADAVLPAPTSPPEPVPRLEVWTKSDLGAAGPSADPAALMTSGATGAGVAALRSAIARTVRSGPRTTHGSSVAATAARCGDGLTSAARALASAADAVEFHHGDELTAVDLRQAIDDLGRVVGAVVTDDILDRIFRRFCIGK